MSLTKRARAAVSVVLGGTTLGLWAAATPPASADVCAQAGVTVDGSTPQRQGPCVVLFPEWNVCSHGYGRVGPVQHDRYTCVIVP